MPMPLAIRRIPTVRPTRGRGRAIPLGLLLAPVLIGLPAEADAATPARAPTVVSPAARRWAVVERVVAQDGGDWQVDYRLKLESDASVSLAPADLGASVDGWVSNSRVPAHAVPRPSAPRVEGSTGSGTNAVDLIRSPDDAKSCRERLTLRAWPAGSPTPAARLKTAALTAPDPIAPVTVAPGGILCVRLRLEHEHFLYGPYDPLLGVRTVALRLGEANLRDVLPTDRPHYLAQAKESWPAPPEDRLDTRHSISGPDSLHLEAHIPGNQRYRFPEKPVRYDSKQRLTFWYLTAPGGDPSGEFRIRLAQYKDSPSGWQVLHEGGLEMTHTVVGKWTKVDRIVKIQPEATSCALDFLIYGADVGEVWIDDVKLEPVGSGPEGP